MTAITGEKFIFMRTDRGTEIRTAASLKELLTELMLNSGAEVALWAEGEAKRCAGIWREEQRLDEPVTITAETHPLTFKALTEIDYDNGAVNRLEPARLEYSIPGRRAQGLASIEAALGLISEEEFGVICTGGDDQGDDLLARSPWLIPVHELLNGYFNGWEE